MGKDYRSMAASRPALVNDLGASMAAACALLCVILALPAVAAAVTGGSRASVSHAVTPHLFSSAQAPSLAVTFERNVGQYGPSAAFIAHVGDEATMALTATGTTVSVSSGATPAQITFDLVGASPAATITGRDQLPGIVNYMIGNNRANWHLSVPTYGAVVTSNAYPGIALAWHPSASGAEYEFDIAPGRDPSAIVWHISGAASKHINGAGALVIDTAAGAVTERPPYAYQVLNGARTPVASSFVLRGDDVGFAVGPYDVTRPLVIDPTLAFSTLLAEGSFASPIPPFAAGIALDAAGNRYVGGTDAGQLPVTAGAYQTSQRSLFVAKFSPANVLLYATYFGGTPPQGSAPDTIGGDYQGNTAGGQHGLAVDAAGDAFITGISNSSDFPTTAGSFQTTCTATSGPSGNEAFVSELDPTGAHLLYSTCFGDVSSAAPVGSAADAVGPGGTVYVTGSVLGTASASDFPTTVGALEASGPGSGQYEGFLAKLNPALPGDGSGVVSSTNQQLVYSTYIGPSETRSSPVSENYWITNDLVVDSSGNAYVTGETSASAWPTTRGAFQTTPGPNIGSVGEAFMTEVAPSGRGSTDLIYSTYLGGTTLNTTGAPGAPIGNGSIGFGISLGPSAVAGGPFTVDVVGLTDFTDFPTTSTAFSTTSSICDIGSAACDAFYSRINPVGGGGSDLVYSAEFGGNGYDQAYDVATDSAGRVYITGATGSFNFPTKNALFTYCCHGVDLDRPDVFVIEVDPSIAGAAGLLFSTFVGGNGADWGNSIAIDANGNVFVVGFAAPPISGKKVKPVRFPTTPNSLFGGRRPAVVSGPFYLEISGL